MEKVSWQWSVGSVTVLQLSTWYDVTWRDMPWNDMTWHYVTWHNITWRSKTWHDVTWHDVTWHDVTWHDVTWRGMTWHEVHDMAWRDITWHEGISKIYKTHSPVPPSRSWTGSLSGFSRLPKHGSSVEISAMESLTSKTRIVWKFQKFIRQNHQYLSNRKFTWIIEVTQTS